MLTVNPLKGRGNFIATSNNMKLVHWPLMGGLLQLTFWYNEKGTGIKRVNFRQYFDCLREKKIINCCTVLMSS